MQKNIMLMICSIVMMVVSISLFAAEPAAEQNIQWQNWSDTAFEQAKKTNHYVLLYGKATWCHWCNQMKNTTLSDPLIVHLISHSFIPVMLDIDQNTKISSQYKIADLPTILILDADRKPIETYQGYYTAQELATRLQQLTAAHDFHLNTTPISSPVTHYSPLSNTLREQLKQKQLSLYEASQTKGWDGAGEYKYLEVPNIEYAMSLGAQGNTPAKTWAKETLEAQFNLIDPFWGGVYLYSSQGDWAHPNFEKKTAIEANNIRIYAEAYHYWHNTIHLIVAQKIADYLEHFLKTPSGTYYAGQKAFMQNGKQDAYYYMLDDKQRRSLGMPAIDKRIITNDNALVSNAYVYLYMATGIPDYLSKSLTILKWIEKNTQRDTGGFYHETSNHSELHLADQLSMIRLYLNLYKVTTNKIYLKKSQTTLSFVKSTFRNDSPTKGFFHLVRLNPSMPNHLTLNAYENSYLARIATLLYHYTGDPSDREIANSALVYLTTPNVIATHYPALILIADARAMTDPLYITVVGSKTDPIAKQLYRAALSYPSFYARIEWWDKKEGPLFNPDTDFPVLDKPAAFVCINHHCSLPVFTPETMTAIIPHLTSEPQHSIQKINEHITQHIMTINNKAFELLNEPWFIIIIGFLTFGFLLAFTPCVLPLLLVIAGMIARSDTIHSRYKMMTLSLTYVLSLAINLCCCRHLSGTVRRIC